MSNNTLKLKCILLSTDGGRSWQIIHQYYLADATNRDLLNGTLEGRTMKMNEGTNERPIDFHK